MPTATVVIEGRSTKTTNSHRVHYDCSSIQIKNETLEALAEAHQLDSIVTLIEENQPIIPASIL
jgi:hypothetical protein